MQSLWGMIGTAVVFHLASLFEARGLPDPEADAAFALGVFAVAMAAAQFLAGVLADRTRRRQLVGGVRGAGGGGVRESVPHRVAAGGVGVRGGAGGGAGDAFGGDERVVAAVLRGPRRWGRSGGRCRRSPRPRAPRGPVLVSLSREHAGGDGPALAGFCGLLLAAGVAGLFLKPPHRPAAGEAAGPGE